jgi:hypothetical protein
MSKPTAEQARKQERDAIVAWLRAEELKMSNDYECGAILWAAEKIERGDHLEGKP